MIKRQSHSSEQLKLSHYVLESWEEEKIFQEQSQLSSSRKCSATKTVLNISVEQPNDSLPFPQSYRTWLTRYSKTGKSQLLRIRDCLCILSDVIWDSRRTKEQMRRWEKVGCLIIWRSWTLHRLLISTRRSTMRICWKIWRRRLTKGDLWIFKFLNCRIMFIFYYLF